MPELDAGFRAEKEKLTALILAGASLAASSTELLTRYVGEAQALDCSKPQIDAALAAAHKVSRTAATKIIASSLGISVGNAKIRLHRARAALRNALQAGCEFSCDERGVLVCEPKRT